MGGGSGSGARSAGPHRRPLPLALRPSSVYRSYLVIFINIYRSRIVMGRGAALLGSVSGARYLLFR